MKCVAIRRLSHQKVDTQTSRKTGVITMEVRAIEIQAKMEYAFRKNDLIGTVLLSENTNSCLFKHFEKRAD
jgi:hypothetical protein